MVMLKKQPKERAIKLSTGETVTCGEAYEEMGKLLGWLFPGLRTEQFEKVIHCRDCQHWKKYHKKGAPKQMYVWLCELDKKRRFEHEFCSDAKERLAQVQND